MKHEIFYTTKGAHVYLVGVNRSKGNAVDQFVVIAPEGTRLYFANGAAAVKYARAAANIRKKFLH